MSEEINVTANTQRFNEIVNNTIHKQGIDKLMSYLASTDFYAAPASHRFHLSVPGGLVQHSLNVYDCLMAKKQSPFWGKILSQYSDETLALVTLFHDLCKINFYVPSTKNVKVYDPDKVEIARQNKMQIKSDSNGYFYWDTVPSYEYDDKLPLGHGEKSVMMLMQFMRLSKDEIFAIRWHMGFSEPKDQYMYCGAAMEMCPLIVAVHECDLEASKIIEVTQ